MSRDQRVKDNWALIYAIERARKQNKKLAVGFFLVSEFLAASSRHYKFMIEGLETLSSKLRDLNLPFYLIEGDPTEKLPQFVETHEISEIITDFSPLKIKRHWINSLEKKLAIPIFDLSRAR